EQLGWTRITADLSEVTGKTIDYLMIGYDNGGKTSAGGAFDAFFDDLRVEAAFEEQTLVNGGFESGGLHGWQVGGTVTPVAETSNAFYGSSTAAQVGSATGSTSTAQTSYLAQVVQIPNGLIGGYLCAHWSLFSNDPTPSNGYQRLLVEDRLNGATYYVLGSATSTAQNT